MSTRTTGPDGLAKRLFEKRVAGPKEEDPELAHPEDWDRPID